MACADVHPILPFLHDNCLPHDKNHGIDHAGLINNHMYSLYPINGVSPLAHRLPHILENNPDVDYRNPAVPIHLNDNIIVSHLFPRIP